MAVWKDEKIAAEALSGVKRVPDNSGKKTYALIGLAAVVSCLAGFAVYKYKPFAAPIASRPVSVPNAQAHAEPEKAAKPSDPAPIAAAAVTPAATAVPVALSTVIPAPAVATAPKVEVSKTAVYVLPPVMLGEGNAKTKRGAPIVESAKAAVLIAAKPDVPAKKQGPFAAAYTALRSGKAEAALESLKTHASPEGSSERKEAAVLEGRAFLKMGKVAEAKQKFEPLAFASADTEMGADALLGNFWCQAGKLTLCRETELEMVRVGADSWGSATAAFEEARRMEENAKGDLPVLEKARGLFQQALDSQKLEDEMDAECLKHLTELTNKVVLDSRTPCTAPKAVFHKVEPGEGVEKIARTFKVNQGQIKRLNKLNDKLTVRYGQALKMLPGEVLYKVSRSQLTGTLYIDGVFIRRYPVGIGPGNATPVGTYIVDKKVTNPDWWYDGKRVPYGDPLNILGTRWMGFSETTENGQGLGLGVHGTAHPESVPGRESKGCVRMHNQEVEEIYDFMPQGGKVQIVD